MSSAKSSSLLMSNPESTDLQALYDSIPVHRDQPFLVTADRIGVRLAGTFDHLSGRGRGLDQAHGGAIAAHLDTAATFALLHATGDAWSTVDLRIDFLRPTPLGAVIVHGRVLRAGRSIGRATAELADGAGKVCASAVGTFVR